MALLRVLSPCIVTALAADYNSWVAGGQQEELQYNAEAAWQKVIGQYIISAVWESSEETQACFSEEVLTSLFIIFPSMLLRPY
jgi:hypothetical protein